MVERFRVELEPISDIELQTNDRAEHFHKAWITLSDSSFQWSHRSSCKIFCFIKLCLTGSASLQDLHKKNFTLFGTDKLQINFQISLPSLGLSLVEVSVLVHQKPIPRLHSILSRGSGEAKLPYLPSQPLGPLRNLPPLEITPLDDHGKAAKHPAKH